VRPRQTVDPGAVVPSIAVLPFSDLSPAKDQEYFSDGLAEELLNALAHVEGLKVVGRTSAFSFKGKTEDLRTIGKKLGVAHVLEGSVRKSNGRVRVTAQLVDVRDGFHVWSHSYDRHLTDIFVVQDDIARAVVDALRIRLVSAKLPMTGQRAANTEVYTQYLLGSHLASTGTFEGVQRGVKAFEKALTIDPEYAPAWSALAVALLGRSDSAPTPEARDEDQRRAVAAAEKAVSLDPGLAAAYASRAYVRHYFLWDWSGAQADIERAIAINPGDSRAHRTAGRLAGTFGRIPQAIVELQKATEVDPLNSASWGSLAAVAMVSGQRDLARTAVDRQLEIAPEDILTILGHGEFLLWEGKAEEARAVFDSNREPLYRLFGLAKAYHQLGRATESQQALTALISKYKHVAAYQIAVAYLWRGEMDPAFEWLERAYLQHDAGLQSLKRGPFRLVRDDRRYVAMLKKLNLPLD
jgi:eukaryotic-like serine/threonine-protein kinase